jgi:hypothetical protein
VVQRTSLEPASTPLKHMGAFAPRENYMSDLFVSWPKRVLGRTLLNSSCHRPENHIWQLQAFTSPTPISGSMKRNQTANEQVPDDNHKIYWYINEHNGRQGHVPHRHSTRTKRSGDIHDFENRMRPHNAAVQIQLIYMADIVQGPNKMDKVSKSTLYINSHIK